MPPGLEDRARACGRTALKAPIPRLPTAPPQGAWRARPAGCRLMRFPLRAKFFLFAALLATAPLALVGQNLVRIARDELKSAANEALSQVAGDLANDFDTTVQGRWMTPLQLDPSAQAPWTSTIFGDFGMG